MNLKSFFYLQRSDRRVLLFFVLFIVISLGTLVFLGSHMTETELANEDSLVQKSNLPHFNKSTKVGEYESYANGKQLFSFDPNTATPQQLTQLGLAPY